MSCFASRVPSRVFLSAPVRRTLRLALLLSVSALSVAYAHTAVPTTTTRTLTVSGATNLLGMAADASGNLYAADSGTGNLYKLTPNNGSYTQSTLLTLTGLYNVAVDAAGNLYLAIESGNSRGIVKETLSNGSYTQSQIATTNGSIAVGVDSSGNVFYGAVNQFYELPVSGSGYGTPVQLSSTYGYFDTVATDPAGNVYVGSGNQSTSSLFLFTKSGSSYAQSNIAVTGATLSQPEGVSRDMAGNLYIGDGSTGTLYKGVPNNGSYALTALAACSIAFGTAVDGSGNVFCVEGFSNTIVEVEQYNDAPTTAVGTAAAQTPVSFLIGTAGTLPALTNANVLTEGVSGLDFTLGTGSTCTGAVTAGQTCTVNVAFTPRYPGQRAGAVNLLSSSGTILATALVNGVGTSPLTAWTLGTQTTLDNTLGDAFGIARDGAGDLFIAAYNVGKVYREKPNGSGGYTQSTLGSGFNSPTQIGVDGAGNVYICDVSNRSITKETLNPATGAYSQSILFSQANNSGLNPYYALAVDADGNLYFTNGASIVQKATYVNGSYTVSTLDSGFNFVIALAVDGSGNVYVADGNAASIYKETPSGSGYVRSNVNATGNSVAGVNGMAVDAGGTVYATANNSASGVVRFAPNGSGGYTQLSTLGSFGRINGVALDPLGNLYVTSDPSGNVLVAEIDRADPPLLSFPTIPVNTSSAESTLELDNIGNAALTLPAPSSGQNPSLSTYFTLSNSSTCPLVYSNSSAGTLAAGASCTEVLSFSPTVTGSVTGNILFTDNRLNATGATQKAHLTGSSTSSLTVTVVSQNVPVGTASITLEFTVGYGGNIAPTTMPTLTVNGSATGVGTITCTSKAGHNTCFAIYNTSALAAGTYTINATQPADSTYTTANTGTAVLTITGTSGSHAAPVRAALPIAALPAR